jgi:hypothetical protein
MGLDWKYNNKLQFWECFWNGDKYWIDDNNGIHILSYCKITDQCFNSLEQAKKYLEDYLEV